jgi:hypothetical protein
MKLHSKILLPIFNIHFDQICNKTELNLYTTDVTAAYTLKSILKTLAFIHREGSYPRIYGKSQTAGNDGKTMYGTELAYAHSTCIIHKQTCG